MGIDLVILDLDMPVMNGYEACESIRLAYENAKESATRIGVRQGLEELLAPPLIIANSADVDDQVRALCQQSGFDDTYTSLKCTELEQFILPKVLRRRKDIAQRFNLSGTVERENLVFSSSNRRVSSEFENSEEEEDQVVQGNPGRLNMTEL
jgi:CheY-like chemotaxis protein